MIYAKEIFEDFLMKGYLSDKGLMAYISLLKGDIIDYQEDVNKALIKGAGKEPRKSFNKRTIKRFMK